MTRVANYCRQSDTSGAGEQNLSLDSQERILREGWAVVAVLREPDVRGWQDEVAAGLRPASELGRCRIHDDDDGDAATLVA